MNQQQTLTTYELAQRWGMESKTLEMWRARGKGPAFVKLGPHRGARVIYQLSDILEYENAHKHPGAKRD